MRKIIAFIQNISFILILFFGISPASWALNCDGKVTGVLSGSPYCSNGQRVGFTWEGSIRWLCSDNKNMDALIMTVYASGNNISVRDNSWSTCNDATNGYVPNHIWFKKPDA